MQKVAKVRYAMFTNFNEYNYVKIVKELSNMFKQLLKSHSNEVMYIIKKNNIKFSAITSQG